MTDATKPKKSRNPSGGPLAAYMKDYVVHLGVLGNTRAQIREKFHAKYNRPIHERTITKIWRDNKVQMDEAQNTIAQSGLEILTGDALKQRSYQLLDTRLKRAQSDESEIEKLRARFLAKEITAQEFDRECARYEQLTINELVKIADMGFEHAHKAGEGPALTPEDQAALTLLTEGLRSGNPLQLIQVLNPTVHVGPSGGS